MSESEAGASSERLSAPSRCNNPYLWVVDPSLRASCALAKFVPPCTARQVTFFCFAKRKSSKKRRFRSLRRSKTTSGPLRSSGQAARATNSPGAKKARFGLEHGRAQSRVFPSGARLAPTGRKQQTHETRRCRGCSWVPVWRGSSTARHWGEPVRGAVRDDRSRATGQGVSCGSARAPMPRSARTACAIRGVLLFGDFLLDKQEKVTRRRFGNRNYHLLHRPIARNARSYRFPYNSTALA